ncbi:hypothetical protein HXX76_005833 [Chlamydomonas incerta]|uniref:Uncharacterized protein n=1 Tax=Chlamydomonas incerta TaxID=51695 RepID=A0A835T1L1_CHLIN|nr:hypothetical protein HXX76_005833 [Chlamydomonas incerta]|eukprot:KAG2437169.1 hypothetical protein HXX76_005833 [Chlamydomonas incerta]
MSSINVQQREEIRDALRGIGLDDDDVASIRESVLDKLAAAGYNQRGRLQTATHEDLKGAGLETADARFFVGFETRLALAGAYTAVRTEVQSGALAPKREQLRAPAADNGCWLWQWVAHSCCWCWCWITTLALEVLAQAPATGQEEARPPQLQHDI